MARKPGQSNLRGEGEEERAERDARLNEGQRASNRNARGFWGQQRERDDEARGLNRDD